MVERDEVKEIGHELDDLANVLDVSASQVVGDVGAQCAVSLAARICRRLSGQLLDRVDADEKVSK